MILPYAMVHNSYQHYFTRLFTQICDSNDCVFMIILELFLSLKGNGHVYLFFNGRNIFWSTITYFPLTHVVDPHHSLSACVWTHIFPIRAALRGAHAVPVIMSLSSLCISTVAQHILQNTHTYVWLNSNSCVCFPLQLRPRSWDFSTTKCTTTTKKSALYKQGEVCVCVFPVVHCVLVGMALSLWFSLIWASVSDTPSH